jgi:ferredoxin
MYIMKVPYVENSECVLCEVCVEVCPKVFELNDGGFVSVTELEKYPENEVDEAIKYCPTDCIRWTEE